LAEDDYPGRLETSDWTACEDDAVTKLDHVVAQVPKRSRTSSAPAIA
jgi:hypothetical protein